MNEMQRLLAELGRLSLRLMGIKEQQANLYNECKEVEKQMKEVHAMMLAEAQKGETI